jgi:predicted molibdopterin-dependent oxidoreductase YjgC
MRLAGFDNRLLPGGSSMESNHVADAAGKTWKTDLKKLFETSGTNISRKIREDKIRAAVVLGENPSIAPDYHHFINNLEFLVVADMFLTETAQAADVFLPLSAYMESEGHLTNWSGLQQQTNPIGAPASGIRTLDIINKLSSLMGYTEQIHSADAVFAELQTLIKLNESSWRNHGSFPTTDGKAHFALYSDQTLSVSAETPQVLAIDARMAAQMKLIRA